MKLYKWMVISFFLTACGQNISVQKPVMTRSIPKPLTLRAQWALPNQPKFMSGELVVEPNTSGFQTQALNSKLPIRKRIPLKIDNHLFELLQLKNSADIPQALSMLRQDPNVRSVSLNPRYHALVTPFARRSQVPRLFRFSEPSSLNDSFYALQWSLPVMGVPQAWELTRGNPETLVAVVDSGVDYHHPDLKDKIVNGLDFMPETVTDNSVGEDKPDASDDDPMDELGHGTHVAGTIAAIPENKIGVAGLAPDVKILNIKVLNNQGWGSAFAIARGITYAVDKGAKVINLSLGSADSSKPIELAVQYAIKKGAVVIAAAGNEFNHTGFPAQYPGVIAVGATNQEDFLADFSNHDQRINVMAPGVDIMSTTPTFMTDTMVQHGIEPHYSVLSGTSMAAPAVSAQAALLLSKQAALTPLQVKELIEKTAKNIGDPRLFGHGRIQILESLRQLAGSDQTP